MAARVPLKRKAIKRLQTFFLSLLVCYGALQLYAHLTDLPYVVLFPLSPWKLGFDKTNRFDKNFEIVITEIDGRPQDPFLNLRGFAEMMGQGWNPWADYKYARDLADPYFSDERRRLIRRQVEKRFFERERINQAKYELIMVKVEVLPFYRGENKARTVRVLKKYEYKAPI